MFFEHVILQCAEYKDSLITKVFVLVARIRIICNNFNEISFRKSNKLQYHVFKLATGIYYCQQFNLVGRYRDLFHK